MTTVREFQGWHHSRIEALLVDVGARLSFESETVVQFHSPRSKAFRLAVLQQLEWNGYAGRFEQDYDSDFRRLVVRHQLPAR
jgi:hypothetical protein